jgi:superoxide dismutase, Fe-Mn family
MAFTLSPLPYAFDALEPHIDARTMEIHHDKHHATYVANLNKTLEGAPELAGKSLEALLAHNLAAVPDALKTAVRNNGGGVWNHDLFWQVMGKNAGGAPVGNVGKAIAAAYGSFDEFKAKFAAAGLGRFGSGWAWLVKTTAGGVDIVSTANQDTPLSEGKSPVLALDVWEHAYYLHYQNRRADYISSWWNVVNWGVVEDLFNSAK